MPRIYYHRSIIVAGFVAIWRESQLQFFSELKILSLFDPELNEDHLVRY